MNNNDVLVSVICTAYNHRPYIRDALEGFVMQKTNFKYEVLISDDASPDNTAEIIKEYEEKYPDLIKPIYFKENQYSQGVKLLRDILAPKVKGKYIAVCEGDDYWTDENKLQMQIDYLEANPEYVMCVHANATTRDNDSDALAVWRFNNEDCDATFEDFLNCLIFPHTATMVMKTDEFHKMIKEFPLSPYAGDYTWRLYSAYAGKVRYIDRVMSVYRRFVPSSWTERAKNDKEWNERRCRFTTFTYYDQIDEFTEFKYHTIIQKLKYKYAFNCQLKREDYKVLYKSDSFKLIDKDDKLKIRIGLISPSAIKIMLKVKRYLTHKKHIKEEKNSNQTHEQFFKKTKKNV